MGQSSIFRSISHRVSKLSSRIKFALGKSSEEPHFDEVVVFYNQVFDLGGYVNPTEAARTLLDQDFALAAPNYVTDEIEVATRFKKLRRLQDNARELSEIEDRIETSGWFGVARWVLRHPLRSGRLWWNLRSNRSLLSKKQQSDNGNREDEYVESADK